MFSIIGIDYVSISLYLYTSITCINVLVYGHGHFLEATRYASAYGLTWSLSNPWAPMEPISERSHQCGFRRLLRVLCPG